MSKSTNITPQSSIETKTEVYTAKDVTPIRKEISEISDNEARLRAAYEYDSVEVRGVFRRMDGSTDPLEFSMRKHKWDKLTKYKLFHGQVHTIPRGVAIHLNEDCKTPVYGTLPGVNATLAAKDAAGNMPDIVGYVNRFSFSSLDFSREAYADQPFVLAASAPRPELITSTSAPRVV